MNTRKAILFIVALTLFAALVYTGYDLSNKIYKSGKAAGEYVKDGAREKISKAYRAIYATQNVINKSGELDTLALVYGTDKGKSAHYFTEVYEYFLSPLKYKAKRIFEIGIEEGASLKMWRDYFPHAVIYGADIKDVSRLNSDTIKTFVADQADRKKLQDFINAFGGDFDLILDDGGHEMAQQQISFGFLFKFVKPGRYYIIEDLHTSLHEDSGGYGTAVNRGATTLAMIDTFIRTGTIKSKYMTAEEESYLTSHLEYCNLFSRDNGRSITCIFKKKE